MTTFSEILKRVYPVGEPMGPVNQSRMTGESRGVRGTPYYLKAPLWHDDGPVPDWKRRIRAWHIEQWNKDPKRRMAFFRMLDSSR